jgi:hypothetical protein
MNRNGWLCAVCLSLLFLALPPTLPAQNNINVNVVGYTQTSDPCQDTTVLKSSVAISISSATTTQLVAGVSGKTIYACKLIASLMGTTPTLQLATGDITTPTNSTFTGAATGGTLLHNTTYYYRITGTSPLGETLASTETNQATAASPTPDTYTMTVTATGFVGATGCNVYGRTTGAELFLGAGTLASGTCTFVDTGAITPTGALPGANTAGSTKTGAFAPTAGSMLVSGGDAVQVQGGSGAALTLVSGGTPSIQGYLVYVQK